MINNKLIDKQKIKMVVDRIESNMNSDALLDNHLIKKVVQELAKT